MLQLLGRMDSRTPGGRGAGEQEGGSGVAVIWTILGYLTGCGSKYHSHNHISNITAGQNDRNSARGAVHQALMRLLHCKPTKGLQQS